MPHGRAAKGTASAPWLYTPRTCERLPNGSSHGKTCSMHAADVISVSSSQFLARMASRKGKSRPHRPSPGPAERVQEAQARAESLMWAGFSPGPPAQLDFGQPVAVIMLVLLRFIPDADGPYSLPAGIWTRSFPEATWPSRTPPATSSRTGSRRRPAITTRRSPSPLRCGHARRWPGSSAAWNSSRPASRRLASGRRVPPKPARQPCRPTRPSPARPPAGAAASPAGSCAASFADRIRCGQYQSLVPSIIQFRSTGPVQPQPLPGARDPGAVGGFLPPDVNL
jgi:hypothetical protein